MATTSQHVAVDKLIDDRPISALQLRVMVLCGSLVFLDGYDIQTLAVSINWLSSEWNLTRTDFTLAQTAAVVGYALSAVLFAGLGDRWGRRPILISAASSWNRLVVHGAVREHGPAHLLAPAGAGFGAASQRDRDHFRIRPRRRAALITVMPISLGAVVAGFAAPPVYAALASQLSSFLAARTDVVGLMRFGLPESVRFLAENIRATSALHDRLAWHPTWIPKCHAHRPQRRRDNPFLPSRAVIALARVAVGRRGAQYVLALF